MLEFTRTFPHLRAAPIVEAVIHWRARTERAWKRDELQSELTARLPDYPKQNAQHEIQLAMEAQLGQEALAPLASRAESWVGFRHSSADDLNIAQFKRDGFVFSRLRPYQDWETFEKEARRLWGIFREVFEPLEIGRLGVRFINRIALAEGKALNEYLVDPPGQPLGMPLKEFLYQSRFSVPNEELGVNIVKTIQRGASGNALIIDSDVFTTKPLTCDERSLDETLPKLRWLKNAIFFELLSPEIIESFK